MTSVIRSRCAVCGKPLLWQENVNGLGWSWIHVWDGQPAVTMPADQQHLAKAEDPDPIGCESVDAWRARLAARGAQP